MSDEEFDPNDLYGESATVETVGAAQPSFFETNRSLIVAAAVLLVTSAAAVSLLINGLGQENRVANPESASNDARQKEPTAGNETPSIGEFAKDYVSRVTDNTIPDRDTRELIRELEGGAIGKAAMAEFELKVSSLRSSFNSLTEKEKNLRQLLDSLQRSELGSKLSGDADSISQYQVILAEFQQATLYETGAGIYLTEIDKVLKSVKSNKETARDFMPKVESFDRVEKLDGSIRSRLKKVKELTAVLDIVLEKSKDNEPGIPLVSAIENSEKLRFESISNRLAEVSKIAKEDTLASLEKRIGEVESEFVKSQTELALAEKEALTAANKQKTDAINLKTKGDLDAAAARIAKAKLEREYVVAQAEINTYLKAFISNGRSNRGDAAGEGPVSYRAVVGSGALEKSNTGVIVCSRWCGAEYGGYNNKNERARGSTVAMLNQTTIVDPAAKSHIAFIEKAQSLLTKFGPLMVEKGVLAE